METLKILKTEETPAVELNTACNNFMISGKCFPENPLQFFEPIMHWFENYIQNPQTNFTLHLDFSYLNSSSSKMLFDIFLMLENTMDKSNVKIYWYCQEDDLMQEQGLYLKAQTKINFEMLTKAFQTV